MAKHFRIKSNGAHPFDCKRRGFDLLEFECDSEREALQFMLAAGSLSWQIWQLSRSEVNGLLHGLMYRPSGHIGPWHDSPSHPHPGGSTH